jgi:tRNA G18 (ribose-2'-O)-methylase SpoU
MPLMVVADEDDPRIADYRDVPDGELLERRGLFVAEGRLVVRRLLTTGRYRARSILVTEAARAALAGLPIQREVPIYVVPQAVINGVTGFNLHRGCLALGERGPAGDALALARDARRLVVLEQVANADNVGGVFRNAAAFAADGVILDPRSTDPLYRKAIRTSVGAALHVPFARATAWPSALEEIRKAGLTLIGLTPSPDAEPVRHVAERLDGKRAALLLGHEGDGLTDLALACCDIHARIPMEGAADSLNVATAAAIALYELGRLKPAPTIVGLKRDTTAE